MFVEDVLHHARRDPSYPERAYIAPENFGTAYSFKMRLPEDLHGDLVLIQWHYLTANSCVHAGYDRYDWPVGWDFGWNTGRISMEPCTVSADGSEGAEQFW